ncbi:TPA: hypothetical protein L5659_001666 [Pseudomonas aeruginosa]|nr:hypothetical protein DY957_01410 [Pseudomonas aeruginosa]HBP5148283.1 hypothetical protein [Pseudomonas aeruginosa]HBP5370078.1 hypothetical protein [Pseudomonas aeruginosa]
MDYLKVWYRCWKGRRYGNKVADLLGIHRGLYHGAMEEGGCEMHLLKLWALQEAGESIERVALHSCQYLSLGLISLRKRFGARPLIEDARGRVNVFLDGVEHG